VELRYGEDSVLQLDPSECPARCNSFGLAGRSDEEELRHKIELALDEPIDFPPLDAILLPDDRVTIALTGDCPASDSVAAALVLRLVQSDVTTDRITLLQPLGASDPRERLPESWRDEIERIESDPENADQFACLGSDDQGEPYAVHRALFDADLILPIETIGRTWTGDYFGVHSGLYPAFSDQQTIRLFRSVGAMKEGPTREQLLAKVETAAQLLGAAVSITIVPGTSDSVGELLIGEARKVAAAARQLYDDSWYETVESPAELVVATIEGCRAAQTWRNVGRALEEAVSLVEEGGSIVLCTELDTPPGEGLELLTREIPHDIVVDHIRQVRPADIYTTLQMIEALKTSTIYFKGKLEDDVVESLNMISIQDETELRRLIDRFESCILLNNAPLVDIWIEED